MFSTSDQNRRCSIARKQMSEKTLHAIRVLLARRDPAHQQEGLELAKKYDDWSAVLEA